MAVRADNRVGTLSGHRGSPGAPHPAGEGMDRVDGTNGRRRREGSPHGDRPANTHTGPQGCRTISAKGAGRCTTAPERAGLNRRASEGSVWRKRALHPGDGAWPLHQPVRALTEALRTGGSAIGGPHWPPRCGQTQIQGMRAERTQARSHCTGTGERRRENEAGKENGHEKTRQRHAALCGVCGSTRC